MTKVAARSATPSLDDTLQEMRDQLVHENGVDPAHLGAVTLKIFLHAARGSGRSMQRWVSRVFESDGTRDRLLWERMRDGTYHRAAASAIVSPDQEANYAAFLTALQAQDRRTIEQVRRALLTERS